MIGEIAKEFMKKKVIWGSISLVVILALFVTNTLLVQKVDLKEGQCVVQYNTCAFNSEKGEEWENDCKMIYKSFKVSKVGDKKVILNDRQQDYELVVSKDNFRSTVGIFEGAISNSLYYYIRPSCEPLKTEVLSKSTEIVSKTEETQADLSKVKWDDLNDQCIIQENECDQRERWQEDDYCHPVTSSFKVLEVGDNNLRVVVWHGSAMTDNMGKRISLTTEMMLSKEDYVEGAYKVTDCGEMITKYPKTFNVQKGR